MTRPTVVLDCDPGVDDAIAILTAARYAHIAAITTVNGNVTVDKTTNNALRVAQLAALDVPIHRGAATPLVAAMHHATHAHGNDGLGNVDIPAPARGPASFDAVAFLLDITRQRSDLHLIALGPLTNVALAARIDPDFVHRLASLTIMGGGSGVGNATAAAEFNIWADPEAAAIVFDAGVEVRTIPLNLTHQVCISAEHAGMLRKSPSPTAQFVADLFDHLGVLLASGSITGAGALHDPCAVLAVTHPHLFGLVERRVDIELAGVHTRGMTVVDERAGALRSPNAAVGYTVDAPAVLQLILDAAIDPR